MSEWQPIETAPKDGSRLLLATPTGKLADGMWSTQYKVWSWPYVITEPTHWMPAPPIPQKAPNAKQTSEIERGERMNEEQMRAEFEDWYKGRYCRRLSDRAASIAVRTNPNGEYDSYHVREAWEIWQAALSAKSVPEQMGSPIQKLMEYLTNILDEDEFNQCDSILAGQGIAAPQPTDNERVRELNQVFDNCRVIFFPKNGEYPIEHNPHANKISKDEILKAIASMSGEQG